jgi:hypothetical protein
VCRDRGHPHALDIAVSAGHCESHNGRPDRTIEAVGRSLSRIKPQIEAAINITIGGSPLMRVDERVKPAGFSSLTRGPTARQQSSREEKP